MSALPYDIDVPSLDQDFTTRLRQIIAKVGNASTLARRVGVSNSALTRYLAGSEPSRRVLMALADAADVSLEWLIRGTGRAQPWAPTDLPKTMTTLPLYRLAGKEPGVFGDAMPTIFRAQAFCSEWLRDQDLDSEHLAAMKMPGDAMRPTLSSGDILLIDTRQNQITDGRIHLITDHTRNLLLRRLQVHIGGQVRVLADNSDYNETTVNADQLTVLGLVVWRGAVLR